MPIAYSHLKNVWKSVNFKTDDNKVIHLIFYDDEAGQPRWKLVSDNNEIIDSATEGFSSKKECIRNFKLLISVFRSVQLPRDL